MTDTELTLTKKYFSLSSSQETEVIYDNGSSFFDALISDIQQSQHQILFETFIFMNDHLGRRLADALQQAAKRGVMIKILVDGCGSPYWSAQFARPLEKSGAQTRVYHPFPWQIWNWSRCVVKIPRVVKWIYLLLNINSRNHRKTCIIDDNIAYIGSINAVRNHLMTTDNGLGWRDTAVRITHCNLAPLSEAFDYAWEHKTLKDRLHETLSQTQTDPLFRLNHSRHRRRVLYKQLLTKMTSARKRLWVTNAYFIPDHRMLKTLCQAAQRGVDVRILIPRKCHILLPLPWASAIFYQNLLHAGVKIYEYLPSILHAKSVIIDNWVLVGSSNLNHRSLLHDLEVDVRLRNQTAKDIVKQLFLADLSDSQELSLESWKTHRPWYQRLLGRLILYVKYCL
ncbi:MAG: cardiolipin synthase B [Coxiellaceae bacterium]|nr:cardiolipin synthase B [Coxiellaceae bacterium]|tara:strand:- start:1191 stop:2378 length:1188 start_codon:yes stop_codon:yes gene_type:complete